MLKENEIKALKELKEILCSHFNVKEIRIFGSKVREEDTPESDIDVMIILEELDPEIQSRIYDIVFEVNLKNDCFISVLIFNKQEIEEGPMSESPIYKAIQKEGILL